MPLVTCPDCGKDVSPSATFCVHCGRPGPFAADASGAVPASPAPIPAAATPIATAPSPPPAVLQCPRCKTTGTRPLCARCDVKTVPAAFDRHSFPRVPVEYAGVGARVGAMLVDLVVMAPVIAITVWLYSRPSVGMIAAGALFGLLGVHGYLVAMHANGGRTVGKRALGIRVRRVDGGEIGWREAVLRESPYLASGIATVLATLLVLSAATPFDLAAAGSFSERMGWINQRTPAWEGLVDTLGSIFALADVVVCLVDKRRRSLHDHLAGTVVVED